MRLWGRNIENARKRAASIGGDCKVFQSLEEACHGADVLVTVTFSTDPVLFGKWVKDGAFVCCEPFCTEQSSDVQTPLLFHHLNGHH